MRSHCGRSFRLVLQVGRQHRPWGHGTWGNAGGRDNVRLDEEMKGWVGYVVAFVLGALLCAGIVLWLAHGSGAKLNADLAAAGDTAVALRTSLADAVAANHGLTDQLSKLQGQFDKSSKLLAADDAIVAKQQRDISSGQRIIDGILGNIAGAGVDLGKQIDAIAEGFGRLYALYHPSPGGSPKGPGGGKSP